MRCTVGAGGGPSGVRRARVVQSFVRSLVPTGWARLPRPLGTYVNVTGYALLVCPPKAPAIRRRYGGLVSSPWLYTELMWERLMLKGKSIIKRAAVTLGATSLVTAAFLTTPPTPCPTTSTAPPRSAAPATSRSTRSPSSTRRPSTSRTTAPGTAWSPCTTAAPGATRPRDQRLGGHHAQPAGLAVGLWRLLVLRRPGQGVRPGAVHLLGWRRLLGPLQRGPEPLRLSLLTPPNRPVEFAVSDGPSRFSIPPVGYAWPVPPLTTVSGSSFLPVGPI